MRTVAFLVACIVGCSKPKAPDCNTVGAALSKTIARKERIEAAKTQIASRCTTDAWPADAVQCFSNATTEQLHRGCFDVKLTMAQREALRHDVLEIWPPSFTDMMAKMTSLKAAMCACYKADCAQKVTEEMTAWTMDAARHGYKVPSLTDTEQLQAQALADEMAKCMQAAMVASEPPTDAQRYVSKMVELKDRVCACSDLACAKATSDEMTRWADDFLKHPNDSSTMSQEGQDRLASLEREIKACMSALRAKHK